MNIIFQISGGIGKSILSTAVCKAIKKKYPNDKLIVVSGYPDVFTNSKDVDMSFGFGQEGYFYTKYIENQDVKVMALEPYVVTEHIKQSEHLIETWCKLNDVPYNGEQPEVFINERERTFYQEKYKSDKPILLMQTNGGAEQQQVKYSWARDIPRHVVQAVVDEFKNDFNIVHIKREDQYGFDGTFAVTDNFKGIAVLIEMSEKRLFMDSFAQHTAAALNKPSTVLWIANTSKVFGYNVHDNIQANPFTAKGDLKNSYFGKFNIVGALEEFPYNNELEIFNIEDVITSLKK
jgi:ADP-heptose:LPS heptosyltransferase